MTLSSRHRIRNSNPGGLRSSVLPLGHGDSPQYWLSHVDGEETFFVSFKPPRPGTEPRTLAWKAAVLTTTLGPPPSWCWEVWKFGENLQFGRNNVLIIYVIWFHLICNWIQFYFSTCRHNVILGMHEANLYQWNIFVENQTCVPTTSRLL